MRSLSDRGRLGAAAWKGYGKSIGPTVTPDSLKLPVIDLESISDNPELTMSSDVVDQLYKACSSHGFFYIRIPTSDRFIVKRAEEKARAFFNLSEEYKRSLSCEGSPFRGYFEVRGEVLGPKQTGDLKEGLDIGLQTMSKSDQTYSGIDRVMHSENKWPDERLVPGFREALQDYESLMLRQSLLLTRGFSLALGAGPLYLDSISDRGMSLLRLLRYPAQDPLEVNEELQGAGAHSDYGLFTILYQESPGLQVQTNEDTWMGVPVIEGTMVVNIGDMTELLSNGLFRSTPHRVIYSPADCSRTRISIPFFFNPNYSSTLSPLRVIRGRDAGPARYSSRKWSDYMKEMYESTF